jgi:hypothetical protein
MGGGGIVVVVEEKRFSLTQSPRGLCLAMQEDDLIEGGGGGGRQTILGAVGGKRRSGSCCHPACVRAYLCLSVCMCVFWGFVRRKRKIDLYMHL